MAKKIATKKNNKVTKTNKSRFKLPALNARSFVLGLVAILLISIVGGTGYNAYRSKNDISAKADTQWITISACRVNNSSTWGFTFKNPTGMTVGVTNGTGVSSFKKTVNPRSSAYTSATVSKSVVTLYYYQLVNGVNPGGYTTKTIYASQVGGC